MIQFKLIQAGLLAVAALNISTRALAETIDFTDNGTFSTSVIEEGGVTVSGSNTLVVVNGSGIGIAGGNDHTLVDPGETITFDFTNPVTNVVINDYQAFDTNGDGLYVDVTLYGFDGDGVLAGVQIVPIDTSQPMDISSILGMDVFTSVDIVMNFDSIIIGSISFQEPDAPALSCSGFDAPFNKALNLKSKSKRSIPVRMTLTDVGGLEITDLDIVSPPVITIAFNSSVSSAGSTDDALLDPSANSTVGNTFTYNHDNLTWEYRLGTMNFSSAGTYTVSVTSGDDLEYQVDAPGGACVQTFTRQP